MENPTKSVQDFPGLQLGTDDSVKLVRPPLHCRYALVFVFGMVIYGHHTGQSVVQDLLDDVRPDLQFVEPGGERTAQIVGRE